MGSTAPVNPEPSNRTIAELALALGMTHTVAGWLTARGHADVATIHRFLDPKLAHLTPPDRMLDRQIAVERLARAVRQRERVVVFGDYDCDGITSAAILTDILRTLGASVLPLLASRFDGGYGLSAAATSRVLQHAPSLVVTCDCGSSDHESLLVLRKASVDVIVIDHHLVPERPLPALAFLNPHRPECGFPYKGLASCGLVLSIAAALRSQLGVKLDVRRWLDLVAIGTIADVAPLDGDNRALVRAGLAVLRRSERPGIRALLALAKVSTDVPLTGRDVAFRLAPHLNAPGRMGAPDPALELLLATDEVAANTAVERIRELSAERRQEQDRILEEALDEIERNQYASAPAIVVGREGWNPGIVGIVAGRLTDRFERPVIVIGFEGATGRGSVRGPAGARLHDALASLADCLIRFGGHQAAAGLELTKERLPELRQRFAQAIEAQVPVAAGPSAEAPLELLSGEDPLSVLLDLDRLEPCGERNPRPRLQVRGAVARAREVTGGHLKLDLDLGRSRVLGCFAPGRGDRASDLRDQVTVVGDLRHTTFPGSGGVELFVEELSPSTVKSSS